MPRIQLASKSVCAANQRFTSFSGFARQTKSPSAPSAVESPRSASWAKPTGLGWQGQDHCDVRAAEAMGVKHHSPNAAAPRALGNIVQVTIGIRNLVIR